MSAEAVAVPPSDPNPPALPPLVVPYASLPTRWGVTCTHDDAGGLRVVVPAVPGWRHLELRYRWYAATCLILIGLLTLAVVRDRANPRTGPGDYAFLYLLLVAVAVVPPWARLCTRTVFLVAGDVLRIHVVAPLGRGHRMMWDRHTVTAVKRAPHSNKLLVRATGRQMTEYAVSPNAQVTEWVAGTVGDAVFAGRAMRTDTETDPPAAPVAR